MLAGGIEAQVGFDAVLTPARHDRVVSSSLSNIECCCTAKEGIPMADRHQVLCVNKSDRPNPHERITHIGGKNGDSTRWSLTQQDAIGGIESGKWAF